MSAVAAAARLGGGGPRASLGLEKPVAPVLTASMLFCRVRFSHTTPANLTPVSSLIDALRLCHCSPSPSRLPYLPGAQVLLARLISLVSRLEQVEDSIQSFHGVWYQPKSSQSPQSSTRPMAPPGALGGAWCSGARGTRVSVCGALRPGARLDSVHPRASGTSRSRHISAIEHVHN